MATRSENLDARTPSLLFEQDVPGWSDLSAEEYFSNLTRYLKNITIFLSRPRLSDLISLDSDAGVEWLIAIPVAYFVVVGLTLGILLMCFWYVDKSGGESPSHSEASVSTMSSVKEDNGLRNVKHDTLVINAGLNSPHHSSVRSYLINTEFQDILRISDGSKGSTRSLGMLTEKDLQVPPKLTSKIPDFTPTGRKHSTNIQAFDNHIVSASDGKFDSRTFTRGKSKFTTALRSEVDLKVEDGSISSRTISSLSTDSLDEKISADSLGVSMEFHKKGKASNMEIGPGDLYGCHRFVQDNADRGFAQCATHRGYAQDSTHRGFVQDSTHMGFVEDSTHMGFVRDSIHKEFVQDSTHRGFIHSPTGRRFAEDVNMNRNTETKMDRKFIFLNHMFSEKRLRDTDSHLKETYEAALKADQMNLYYTNTKDPYSSSFFPSIHFPGHEHSEYRRPELTPFPNAYTLNYENSEVFSEARHEQLVKNMGTNCQKMHFENYITTHMNAQENNVGGIKTKLFTSRNSIADSQMTSEIFTDEDTRSSNDGQRTNLNDISLVSFVLSDEHGLTFSSDPQKDDFQAPADAPDFDISSVSQIAMSSQGGFDNSQESFGSGGVRPNEGSFCSTNNSLPSSIARFHASNIGQWPSPCAGYSLPSETDLESSQNECLCKDCHCKSNSRSSLSVNFGSFSESATTDSRAALSQDNSPHLPQNGSNCDPGSNKSDQGLVKLSKRPSPLSSFVNNIKQRYSFDDNCLKFKVSDEEEALLLSPLLQRGFGTKLNKQSSLDSKRRKVSVEERLQEYGFLKYKGKKYVINPSPGKYETGAGYYNLVFTNNEDVLETPKYGQDSSKKQNSHSHSANGSMEDGSLAGVSDGISKSAFSQHADFASDYQHSPFMEDSFYHFSRSRFNQREEFAVTETCSDMEGEYTEVFDREAIVVKSSPGQDSGSVFEAHCGDDSVFSDHDFTQAESRNKQTATEIGLGLSSFSDHGDSNTFEKQPDNLVELKKNKQKARLFSNDFVSPGNKELVCASLPKMKIQTNINEQAEPETYEIIQNCKPGHGQSCSYGKSQNYTPENTQINDSGEGKNGTDRKGQNYIHENTERYENSHTGYYENAPNGKYEQTQIAQHNNSQQSVNKELKLGTSSSSDVTSIHSNLVNATVREEKCASSKKSLGKASMEAQHKMKRQQASMTLLSLEKGFSLREMHQDRENGFSRRGKQQGRDNGFSGREKQHDRENGFPGREMQQDRENAFPGREKQQDRENGFPGREKQQDRDNDFSARCGIQQDTGNGFRRHCEMQQNPESEIESRSRLYRPTIGNLQVTKALEMARF